MKKLLVILLSTALMLSLTACGSDDDSSSTSSIAQSSSKQDTLTESSAQSSATDSASKPASDTSADENKKLARGTFNGDVYESAYSGLKFSKPESWVYYTDEEMAAVLNLGVEYLGDKFAEAAETITSVYDMMVVDSLTGTNLSVGYENLNLSFLSNLTEKQYIEAVKAQFATITTMDVVFSDETETVSLSGNDYLRSICTVTSNGVTMTQIYYLRNIDGYMNFIIVTLVDGYEVADIEAMFN